jgi:hypothetical protein
MKKIFVSVLAVFLLSLLSPKGAQAKRKLPRSGSNAAATKNVSTASSAKGITTKVVFRSDRKAINATFSNLSQIYSVSYDLRYDANGVTQGVAGSITNNKEGSVLRELIFGTCSANICRYDIGVTNARLIITTTLKNGTRIIKPYTLRV